MSETLSKEGFRAGGRNPTCAGGALLTCCSGGGLMLCRSLLLIQVSRQHPRLLPASRSSWEWGHRFSFRGFACFKLCLAGAVLGARCSPISGCHHPLGLSQPVVPHGNVLPFGASPVGQVGAVPSEATRHRGRCSARALAVPIFVVSPPAL